MLKAMSASCQLPCVPSRIPARLVDGREVKPPLVRVVGSISYPVLRNPVVSKRRAFFCEGAVRRENGKVAVDVNTAGNGRADMAESKAIVSTDTRLEDYPTVIAVPLPHRPLFPGFHMKVDMKDPNLLAALKKNHKRSVAYAGAFILKDEPTTDPSTESGSDSAKSIYDLKGKELFKRLHEVGTLAQITKIQGDQVELIGHQRLRIIEMVDEDPLIVKVEHLKEKPYNEDDDVIKATSYEVMATLRDIRNTNSPWKDHIQTYTQHVDDVNYPRLADLGAAVSGANKLLCQQVLEELDVYKRLKLTLQLLKRDMVIRKIQESVAKEIEQQMTGELRRYWLNEQLKAIKKELGLETNEKSKLIAKFKQRLETKREQCPPHVLQAIEEELNKLEHLETKSSEFGVTCNYLDWLTGLPWGSYSDENFNIQHAQKILDEDHYGIFDVKERILEFIAVGKLRGTSQGKIMCLCGPPGVGKTSIGCSIARALNRRFYRFSVGGLADVAEIKGHRRTYVGAMPGKMVQCLKNVETANPLVLIDEIDKLGRGHSGDPASALLELLDPEQNVNFLDHYLDVPIDLSKVMFVCTANTIETIPNPLLDRMEVIALAGYITDEKMHIARDHLEKSAREACGIKSEQVEVTDAALLALIENYCREAGVRNLQKHIEKIYSKIALQFVQQGWSNELSPAASLQEGAKLLRGKSTEEPSQTVGDGQVGKKLEDGNSHKMATTTASIESKQKTEDTLHEQSNGTALQESEATSHEHLVGRGRNVLPSLSSSDNIATADQLIDSKVDIETTGVKDVKVDNVIEKVFVDVSNLADFVGKPLFQSERIYDQTPVGVVMGLAWTAMGGAITFVETVLVEQGEGRGALLLTGQLGDVMKESARIAHTVARAILLQKEPDNPFFANSKLHLHLPAGATPKDGASGGCTMVTSMLSLAMEKCVKKDLAMTGEVTLTGRILPIGGVREKTIAARRNNVKTLIFPSDNRGDFDQLSANTKAGLEVHFVDDFNQIFELAFESDS